MAYDDAFEDGLLVKVIACLQLDFFAGHKEVPGALHEVLDGDVSIPDEQASGSDTVDFFLYVEACHQHFLRKFFPVYQYFTAGDVGGRLYRDGECCHLLFLSKGGMTSFFLLPRLRRLVILLMPANWM